MKHILGWYLRKEGEYKIGLPRLSEDEEEVLKALENKIVNERIEVSSEKELAHLLRLMAEEMEILLEEDQIDYLSTFAYLHIYGLGGFEALLKDDNIEEISVIGLEKPVYVFLRNKGWKKTNLVVNSDDYLMELINKMAKETGRRITFQKPKLNAMLPDGSRLHASLWPVSKGELTIRRFSSEPFSIADLVSFNTLSLEMSAILSIVFQCDNNILIAGNTASGKTTSLNAFFAFVPANERIVIMEETPEINLPHPHQIRIVANDDLGISMMDLIHDSLRMRPDRAIIGEVRTTEEIGALVESMLAGQARGSYATIHGKSSKEVVQRILSSGVILEDMDVIDAILVQRRMLIYNKKKRRSEEIRKMTEMVSLEGNKRLPFIDRASFSKTRLFEKAMESFNMSKRELLNEIKEREKILKAIKGDYLGVFREYQKRIFSINF